jgi:hypothetical protein
MRPLSKAELAQLALTSTLARRAASPRARSVEECDVGVGKRIDCTNQRVAEGANLEKAQRRADVLRMHAGQYGDQIELAQTHRHLLNKQQRRDLQRISAARRRDPDMSEKFKVLLRQIVEAIKSAVERGLVMRSRTPFEPDSVESFLLKVAFLAAIFLLALLVSYLAK